MNASGAIHRQPASLSPLWGQDEENFVTTNQLLDLSLSLSSLTHENVDWQHFWVILGVKINSFLFRPVSIY